MLPVLLIKIIYASFLLLKSDSKKIFVYKQKFKNQLIYFFNGLTL